MTIRTTTTTAVDESEGVVAEAAVIRSRKVLVEDDGRDGVFGRCERTLKERTIIMKEATRQGKPLSAYLEAKRNIDNEWRGWRLKKRREAKKDDDDGEKVS